MQTSLNRASTKPQTRTEAATPRGQTFSHDDHTSRRGDQAAGLTPEEIRQIVLDILG